MKQRRNGVKGDMALKIDISKAYDRVDWGFLQHMMLTMGSAEISTKILKSGFPRVWV